MWRCLLFIFLKIFFFSPSHDTICLHTESICNFGLISILCFSSFEPENANDCPLWDLKGGPHISLIPTYLSYTVIPTCQLATLRHPYTCPPLWSPYITNHLIFVLHCDPYVSLIHCDASTFCALLWFPHITNPNVLNMFFSVLWSPHITYLHCHIPTFVLHFGSHIPLIT